MSVLEQRMTLNLKPYKSIREAVQETLKGTVGSVGQAASGVWGRFLVVE